MKRSTGRINKRVFLDGGCLFIVALLLSFFTAGCATISPVPPKISGECQALWHSMEDVITREKVRDSYAPLLDGYDYLRADRFLLALGQLAHSSREEHALIEQMRVLDLQRRYLELEFLSDSALADLIPDGTIADEGVFKRHVASCSAELLQADRRDPDYFHKVMKAVNTDQDYSTLYRILGLYPVTQLYVGHRIKVYEDEHPVLVGAQPLAVKRIIEPRAGRPLSAKRIELILRNGRLKPFLNFQFAEQELDDLVRHYSPVFELGGDSFGRISKSGARWQVDEHDPVVYYYLSHALIQGIPALQINYVIWFNERREPAPWYTAGHLDGMNVRVTLDWQGRPLVYDSIGNCGCFYFGLLNDDLVVQKPQGHTGFSPRIAGLLPRIEPSNHLSVQVESGSNRVVGVATRSLDDENQKYRLLPYALLERHSGELQTKFFDEDGYVDDTSRLERYFLFPMGIPNIGAMRQRGRQPITLVGRAYFDDPYLLADILVVKAEVPAKNKLLKSRKKRQSNLQRRVEAGKSMSRPGRSRRTDKYERDEDVEQ
ncbi:MAG: hypothetical protein PF442_03070 [Desulfobulbaceae bacterium]|nr:hypothetical protein [Desulfobulbaceae bacterium]